MACTAVARRAIAELGRFFFGVGDELLEVLGGTSGCTTYRLGTLASRLTGLKSLLAS